MSLATLLGNRLHLLQRAGMAAAGLSSVDDYSSEFTKLGLRFLPSKRLTRTMDPLSDLLFCLESYRLFQREQPDIVATYGLKPGIYARLAARLAGVPVVVHTSWGLFFQDDAPWYRKLPILLLEKASAPLCDYAFSENRDDLARMQRWHFKSADRLGYLGNATDVRGRFDPARFDAAAVRATRAAFGLAPDGLVVGVVGRLTQSKGLSEFLAAAQATARRHPGVQFVWIGPRDASRGDGISASDRRALAAAKSVTLLGNQPHAAMPALYAMLDIVVLPSHREGFPRALVEAAAMARPIVATDIRGCREAVDHGLTGLLVPPRDAAALTQSLVALLEDAGLRQRMGHAGRAKALREFDEEQLVARILEVYRKLLDQKGKPCRPA